MPLLLPLLFTWEGGAAVGLASLGIGAAAATYKGVDNTTSGIKNNILPLALIGAGTFLALRVLVKGK